jgi:hypothetical protein
MAQGQVEMWTARWRKLRELPRPVPFGSFSGQIQCVRTGPDFSGPRAARSVSLCIPVRSARVSRPRPNDLARVGPLARTIGRHG